MLVFSSCEDPDVSSPQPQPSTFILTELTEPGHYPGIPIYTADMAKNRVTEVNSEWVVRKRASVQYESQILRNKYNALHKISFDNFNSTDDFIEFVLALHGKLVNRVPVPEEFLVDMTGINFRAISFEQPIVLTLEALDINGEIVESQDYTLQKDEIIDFNMNLNNQSLHHLAFKIEASKQTNLSDIREGAYAIDDVYIKTSDNSVFIPSQNDSEVIDWLKESSIRYFLWNYRDVGGDMGVVLEGSDDENRVSTSGLGYAYAIYILAEQENMITSSVARARILAMLKWQQAQNWFNGSQGVFGFPLHYYFPDGSGDYVNSPQAISTIDWAINAAGIRTVKQKYSSDAEIVTLCNELLSRPQWQNTIHNNSGDTYRFGRISKGLSITGTKNGQVWADAFSEETEIIYLEALASGTVPSLDLSRIYREQQNGYYISWFGAGFTYNWLQLWTGTVEPYQSNSTIAYQNDFSASNSSFGLPLMGLTACNTLSDVSSKGFVNWDRYISNQGSFVSGAPSNEVIQVSPAPYGAALALPFQSSNALESLRAYVQLGYYHPLLGLPDNIRVNNLPNGITVPVPNWSTFDINIGPIAMAIEQTQSNSIASYFINDPDVTSALNNLIQSFQ
jgi:hypothetical protein